MATKSSDVLAEIRRAFAAADADGNGVITPNELFGMYESYPAMSYMGWLVKYSFHMLVLMWVIQSIELYHVSLTCISRPLFYLFFVVDGRVDETAPERACTHGS